MATYLHFTYCTDAKWAKSDLKTMFNLICSEAAIKKGSVKKGTVKNFASFTGNLLCWSFFLIKLTPTQEFFCEVCEIFKNTYFEEHMRTATYVHGDSVGRCRVVV